MGKRFTLDEILAENRKSWTEAEKAEEEGDYKTAKVEKHRTGILHRIWWSERKTRA